MPIKSLIPLTTGCNTPSLRVVPNVRRNPGFSAVPHVTVRISFLTDDNCSFDQVENSSNFSLAQVPIPAVSPDSAFCTAERYPFDLLSIEPFLFNLSPYFSAFPSAASFSIASGVRKLVFPVVLNIPALSALFAEE